MRTIIVVSLLAAGAAGAVAQPVWRCGNSFGSVPCEGGAVMRAPAPVSAAEAARARTVAKTDARLADAMEKARIQQEKQAPKAVIPAAKQAAAAAAPASRPVKKPAPRKGEPGLLTAVAPAPKEPKK